jgi:hypothetical protein
MLDEWSGDDVDELFEILETRLGELNIDLKYEILAKAETDDEEFDDDDDDDDVEEEDDDEED